MKKSFTILSLVFAIILSSCNNQPPSESITNEIVKLKWNDALIIGDPFNYGIENIVLFPVGSNYEPHVYEKKKFSNDNILHYPTITSLSFCSNVAGSFYDPTAKDEYINIDENRFDIRNILFYNLNSRKSYSLISDTLHILSFALHKDFKKPLIFYRIVKEDYNRDSVFNKEDAVMLYVSDLYGKSLTQITPDNEQFIGYTLYEENGLILIKTVIDSNNDKAFTNYDETNFREMNLLEPKLGKELFSESLKDSLRSQLKFVDIYK